MLAVLKNYFATIRRHLPVTILNFIGLAAAFVAFMLILMQINFEFGYDDFHPASDRIYRVEAQRSDGTYWSACNRLDGDRFTALLPSIEQGGMSFTMGDKEARIRHAGQGNNATVYKFPFKYVTATFPATLQLEVVEGSPDLNDLSQVLIPRSMARMMFGDKSPLGKKIEVVGEFRTITDRREFYIAGVYKDMPANSIFRNGVLAGGGNYQIDRLGNRNWALYLRLDSPDSKEQVESLINAAGITSTRKQEITRLRLTLVSDIYFTKDYHDSQGYMSGEPVGDEQTTTMFLFIAILVVAIAAINYFNFAVAQAPLRVGSINMQKILGGTLAVLRGGMILESVAFSALAYLLALLGLYGIETSSLMSYLQADMTMAGNPGILIAGLGIAVAIGLLVGLYPAFYITSIPAVITLKGSFGLSFRGRRVRTLLIGFQYVVSIGLILSAVFMNLQYRLLCKQELGFNQEQVVAMPLTAKLLKQRTALDALLGQNSAIEGISYAAKDFFGNTTQQHWGFRQKSNLNPEESVELDVRQVPGNFIPLMDMKVVEGRNFTASEEFKSRFDLGYPGIINRRAQEVYGLHVGEMIDNIEIIGVVEDFNYRSLHSDVDPLILVGFGGVSEKDRGTAYLKIRTEDYPALFAFMRTVTQRLDPDSDGEPYLLDAHMERLYQADAQNTALVTFFSFLAILISLSGIFSLISFETYFRRKEVGVRRVFGASVREILELFNWTYVRVVAVGFVLAAPLVWYGVQVWLRSYTVQVSLYWWVFASVFCGVVVLTVVTVTWLSYRVATDNPVRSLKTE